MPAQILPHAVRIAPDHVLEEMLKNLGARVARIEARSIPKRALMPKAAIRITNTHMVTIITTRTIMATKTHRVSHDVTPLLVWLSPSFPIGSYAYSHGVEWAVEAGDIRDLASLEAWTATLLEHGGPWSDAVLFSLAHKAASVEDGVRLAEISELAAALSPSKERRMETLNQGAAFLTAVRAAWPCKVFDLAAPFEDEIAFPVAVALAAAGHHLALAPALEAYLVAFVSILVSAAMRLVPLGQTDGMKAVAKLVPLAKKIAVRAADATVDDIGGAAFRSDIASMRHETQYTRLFRS